VAEPTIDESARLMRALDGLGVVRRLDRLHSALCLAYTVGRQDEERVHRHEREAESCLEG
jgi:hypothetical protein